MVLKNWASFRFFINKKIFLIKTLFFGGFDPVTVLLRFGFAHLWWEHRFEGYDP